MKVVDIEFILKEHPYISLFSRFGNIEYAGFDTYENALNALESNHNQQEMVSVAMIESDTKEMIWHSEYVGEVASKLLVHDFLNKGNFKVIDTKQL